MECVAGGRATFARLVVRFGAKRSGSSWLFALKVVRTWRLASATLLAFREQRDGSNNIGRQ